MVGTNILCLSEYGDNMENWDVYEVTEHLIVYKEQKEEKIGWDEINYQS